MYVFVRPPFVASYCLSSTFSSRLRAVLLSLFLFHQSQLASPTSVIFSHRANSSATRTHIHPFLFAYRYSILSSPNSSVILCIPPPLSNLQSLIRIRIHVYCLSFFCLPSIILLPLNVDTDRESLFSKFKRYHRDQAVPSYVVTMHKIIGYKMPCAAALDQLVYQCVVACVGGISTTRRKMATVHNKNL
ncbi:hypothetical protein C8Q75DRAFT_67411 [Abortiporus biennis]|nr:hypothetical protein C8Q75DRAFT_67411 [Abortiporus biennis]